MSYTDRISERIGIYIDGIDSETAAGASSEFTSQEIDMDDQRQVAFLLRSLGTGTVSMTVQAGVLTSASAGGTAIGNKYGNTSGNEATFGNLVVGTNTATYEVTGTAGENEVIEIDASSLPDNVRYLRAIVNNGTVNTFSSLVTLVGIDRYPPEDHGTDITPTVLTEIE